MKNAYQRRRVKARVEKRARMMRLDAISLEFARQVIEEETGTPLEISPVAPGASRAGQTEAATEASGSAAVPAAPTEAKLIARDERKNPLISKFEWAADAAQRVLRVPAGFMRNKTQERIEELARDRSLATIDLSLVEEGIEIGKKMMAEMIANYPTPGTSSAGAAAPKPTGSPAETPERSNGSGYLNEVSPLTARTADRS
jgi:hypothetical protein